MPAPSTNAALQDRLFLDLIEVLFHAAESSLRHMSASMPESKATRRPLRPGLYGPLPTFFDDNQELDLDSFGKHLLSIAAFQTCIAEFDVADYSMRQIWQRRESVSHTT
jgi:hypothetical protein